MLYGGEDKAFTSFKAGSNFVNLPRRALRGSGCGGGA
jgi:hypothetical protein